MVGPPSCSKAVGPGRRFRFPRAGDPISKIEDRAMKLVFALIVIGYGVDLLAHGRSLDGFALIVVAVASLIVVLVYEHTERGKEPELKRRALKGPRPQRASRFGNYTK
jgi:hypothetical protein